MKRILSFIDWIKQEKIRFFSSSNFREEMANWISHALGVLFGALAGGWMLILAFEQQSLGCFVATGVYVASFILLYSSSTLYHIFHAHPKRKIFRLLDHISIYVLIAGSYTPFLVCYMDNFTGRIYLWILWVLVVLGSLFKLLFLGRYKWISLLLYLFMGWIAVFIFPVFYNELPIYSFVGIVVGGLFYSLGVVFYVWKRLYFNHFIWHLFVMAGSISHFVAVYYSIVSLQK
ncbi:MAG: hemolysin III family protein [Marinifilaceae bacterium]|jgi:hemolysin III